MACGGALSIRVIFQTDPLPLGKGAASLGVELRQLLMDAPRRACRRALGRGPLLRFAAPEIFDGFERDRAVHPLFLADVRNNQVTAVWQIKSAGAAAASRLCAWASPSRNRLGQRSHE